MPVMCLQACLSCVRPQALRCAKAVAHLCPTPSCFKRKANLPPLDLKWDNSRGRARWMT